MTTTNIPNKGGVQFKRQLTAGTPATVGVLNNGGSSGGGAVVSGSQKFSLTSVGGNAMTKTISIAGQPGSTGNKFYIHSASLLNSTTGQQQQQQQQITLSSAGGGGGQTGSTKSLQYLTPANIKFNFTGATAGGAAAGQVQDIKSILTSSLGSNIIINEHGSNNLVGAASSGAALPTLLTAGGAAVTQQQQQQQGVVGAQQQPTRKTMNVYMDADKRFLYTNNRGQFVAQLNPSAKMVNIVPVQQQQGIGGGAGTATGGQLHQQHQQVLATSSPSGLNSNNTKIITTTKGGVVQQTVLDGSNRIVSGGARGFPTVQRLRSIRNSGGQQQQQHQQHQLQGAIAKQVVAGNANEVRTFNRVLIQSSHAANVAMGGDPNGGGTGAGSASPGGTAGTVGGGGGGGEANINLNAINR